MIASFGARSSSDRRPRFALGALLLVALALAPAPAHAAETPAEAEPRLSTEARADRLFRAGEKKFDSGDYAGACEDFSESLKLGPKLGALLNLALCHETIGKPVTAWHEFSHAAAWAAQNNQRERHEFATQHMRALEPKLPRVILQLPVDRAIDGLDLDGEPVPEQRWYLPLYVDPGEHHLGVTAPGKQRATVSFRVAEPPSEQVVYIPHLADEVSVEAPPAPRPRPATDTTRRALGFVGLGLGATGVITGATFGTLAITADARDPAVQDQATAATVAFVSGAAFAAIGGWLLWTSTTSAGPRTALTAAPNRGGAAFGLTTSF